MGKEEVFKILKRNGGWLNSSQIRDRLAIDVNQVNLALRSLVRGGYVITKKRRCQCGYNKTFWKARK